MDNIIIVKAADYLHDGVHFTDVRQKLVAQAGSFRGSLDQTGNIHDPISVGMIFSEPDMSERTCRRGSGTVTIPTFGSMVQKG